MNPQLQELYKQTLLAHSKQPRNAQAIADASRATVRNPLCGDEVTVYLKFNHTTIQEAGFVGRCCSICTASASMMTERLANSDPTDAAHFAQSLVSNFTKRPEHLALEGDLAALQGVLAFPSRIRCATLPWEALLRLIPAPPPS